MLCPGQGAQHAGMLDLAHADANARAALDEAQAELGVDPRDWLHDTDAMFANATAQPLLCVVQLAVWRALRERLPAPTLFAGYSVGELACYGLADSLSAGDLARLATRRAHLMDDVARGEPGGLLGVRGLVREALVAQSRAAGAHIAIAIADDAFVLGGTDAALSRLQSALAGSGAQLTSLRVGVPSHTPLLQGAVAAFRTELEHSPLSAPSRPVIAGIDGQHVATRERAIAALSAQIATTIEWGACLDTLYERGCRVYLELPPGRALSKMVRDRFDDAEARAVDEFRDLGAVAHWVRRKTGG